MPTFRFLHAAGFDPDAVLANPPARFRDVFAAAPVAAVERLITRAIELDVDAVVLMPAVASDGPVRGPSLHAETALREQFARLAGYHIAAFVAVGTGCEGWQRLAGRGSHAVVLSPGEVGTVPDLEGRPRATFRCVADLEPPEHAVPLRTPDAVEIVLAPTTAFVELGPPQDLHQRYLALGKGESAAIGLEGGIADAPGPMQSLGKGTGRHGVTLVTFDGLSKPWTEFVSTSVLRFEELTVEAEPTDALDDLALRMTEKLEGLKAESGEQAWVVRWTIEAAEPLFATLNDPVGRIELCGLLPAALGEIPVEHELRIVPHPIWPALNDPFAAEFEAALQEQVTSFGEGSLRLLALPDAAPHRRRLERLVDHADSTAVLGEARRFGLRVISAAHDEEDSE